MILPDVNILLYAHNKVDLDHEKAKSWLETALTSPVPFCLTWHTVMGFLRISTSSRIFPSPLNTNDALAAISLLIGAPNSTILTPGKEHFRIFTKLVNEARLSGPKLMDAHIAAIAIEHGATVATADRDFRLFDDLRLVNPIAPRKK